MKLGPIHNFASFWNQNWWINYSSGKKQSFVKFSLKMVQKRKSLTLLTTQIINYNSHKIFLHGIIQNTHCSKKESLTIVLDVLRLKTNDFTNTFIHLRQKWTLRRLKKILLLWKYFCKIQIYRNYRIIIGFKFLQKKINFD